MEQKSKSEYEQIKDFIVLCLKRWYYFAISLFICGIVGGLYYVLATPIFQISTTVSLRHDESIAGGASSSGSSVLSAFGFGKNSENIEDETLKINSQGYIKNVVKNLDLNRKYTQTKLAGFSKKALYDKSPIILSVDESISDTISVPLSFKLQIQPEQTKIKVKLGFRTIGTYTITSYPAVLNTIYGDFILSKSPYYDEYKYPMNLKIHYGNYDSWAQIYRAELVADFEKKTSDIIYLSVNSPNIPFTKTFLSAIIDNYNEQWDSDKNTVSTQTILFIEERLKAVMNKLSTADREIQEFKDKYSLTEIEADVAYYLTQSGEIQAALLEAENQSNLTDLIVDFVNDPNNKYTPIPLGLTISEARFIEIINKYNEELTRRNDMYKNNAQSSLSAALDRTIEIQRETLLRSLNNVKEGLKLTVDNIKKKERELDHKIGNIPQIERDYVQLRREQELQQGIYIFLLEIREQAGIRGISILPKLKVIDEPYVLNEVVSPSFVKTVIMILFFGGIAFPLSFIYGLPYLRKRKNK